MYQSNLRLGTAKTKSRGEVRGSTKKMYRQKGTGNARAGSRRSGIRRGGGHIFAKRPRDWTYRLPRKAVQLATRMALAAKLRDAEVTLIDELSFEGPKTKDMATVLKALGLDGQQPAGHDGRARCQCLQECPEYRPGRGGPGLGFECLESAQAQARVDHQGRVGSRAVGRAAIKSEADDGRKSRET